MTCVTFLDADAPGGRGWHVLDKTGARTACGMMTDLDIVRYDGTFVWVKCVKCRAILGNFLQDGRFADEDGVTHVTHSISWIDLTRGTITRAWTTWESACEQESDQGTTANLVNCLECLALRAAS